MKSKRNSIIYTLLALLTLPGAMLLSSCREDFRDEPAAPGLIDFRAYIQNVTAPPTRALDSVLVTTEQYGIDFHMEMVYNEDGERKSDVELYRIPTGQEGRLSIKGSEDDAFNWHGLTSPHTFWGWTMPWETKSADLQAVWAEPLGTSYGGQTYDEELQPIRITFPSSGDGEDYNKYNNNDVYETFVGMKRGPVDYYHNGQYVELTFKHLVSKIVIKRLTLHMSDGSIQHDVKGNITFLGMPDQGIFYPHPKNDKAPVVKTIPKPDGELTYYIKSDPEQYDNIYVCPEIDFSQLAFYIDITDERYSEYGDHGDYFGTFDNVTFIREKGEDFDLGGDEKILHAGEMMEMNIELYPGMGPGLGVIIKEWSTNRSGDAEHHSHPGIYTDSQASSFTGNADWSNLYELYGEVNDEGEKVFRIYENVEIKSSSFPVGAGYIVEGKGHQLTMTSSNNVVTVGAVRDIYITDGKNSVYIDGDGNIYTFKDGVLSAEPTGRINLTPGSSNRINLSTGRLA